MFREYYVFYLKGEEIDFGYSITIIVLLYGFSFLQLLLGFIL